MPNRRVYQNCKWCGETFCGFKLKEHVGTCAKSSHVITCAFCQSPINLKSFQQHMTKGCQNRPDIPPGHKICTRCQKALPYSDFALDRFNSGSGRHARCKTCFQEASKPVRQTAEYKLKHRHQNLNRTYGMSKEAHDAQLESQGGACAICRRKPGFTSKKDMHLYVDHCHATGKIRRLLCFYCNFGLGNFRDDPALLIEAALYILHHRQLATVS